MVSEFLKVSEFFNGIGPNFTAEIVFDFCQAKLKREGGALPPRRCIKDSNLCSPLLPFMFRSAGRHNL